MARRVSYLKSGVAPKDYPPKDRPEIAIAGRSNAGKSSFINAIAKSLVARTSQEPGKTRTLNFYDVGEFYRLVDMPGYGFAARATNEQEMWQQMVETYLTERDNLVGLLLLMDIRREWTSDEELILQFSQKKNLPVIIILTKSDEYPRADAQRKIDVIKKASKQSQVWAVSAKKKQGVEEVEKEAFDSWVLTYKGRAP